MPETPLLLRALRLQPTERTPLWLMRQAGRYLPEYRKIRAEAGDFLTLCKTPALACEVTLQPLRRFDLDAAIVFSDILTIPDAMGLGLFFQEGEGPAFRHPLHNSQAIKNITIPSMEELSYVMQTISLCKANLSPSIPLIGFSGSPWTLACYMVEGKSNKNFPRLQALIKEEPLKAHGLLACLAETVSLYLIHQIQAGADVLMLFDTWGGLLNTPDYLSFSLSYLHLIIQKIKQHSPTTPIILFTKGGKNWLKEMAATGCDGVGVDWTCSLQTARKEIKDAVCLQGNLDPSILLEDKNTIRAATANVLADYGKGNGHIFNLGHGVTPQVPPENVQFLIETVRELSPAYKQTV